MLELRERIAKAAGVKLSADEGETTKLYWYCLLEMSFDLRQKVSFLNKDICFIAEKKIELNMESSLVFFYLTAITQESEREMVKSISSLDTIVQQKEDLIVRCLQQYNQLNVSLFSTDHEQDITIENLEKTIDQLMNEMPPADQTGSNSLIHEFESKVDSVLSFCASKLQCRKRILEDDGMMINVVEKDPKKKFRCPITGAFFVNPVKKCV